MKNYAIYETSSGRIVRVGTSSSPDVSGKAGSGQTAVVCDADPETDYILGGAATPRPVPDLSALNSAVAGTAVSLSGLPEGTVVTATPENGETEMDTVGSDGLMEATFATAGAYIVSVSEVFPHLPTTATVEIA